MAFLGLGIIYKAVSGPREGNVRNPSTTFVYKMEVIHVLWPNDILSPPKKWFNLSLPAPHLGTTEGRLGEMPKAHQCATNVDPNLEPFLVTKPTLQCMQSNISQRIELDC